MADASEKPLGLHNVVSVSMGLIVSMSCLVSLGQGAGESGLMFIPAMLIALLLNICSAACMAELNALMPNATGGLVQYTLAGLGPCPRSLRWWADTSSATSFVAASRRRSLAR